MPFGVDIICACFLVVALYNGYQQGVSKAGTQLFFLFVALLIAWVVRIPVGNVVVSQVASDIPSVFAELIAFLLLFPLLTGLLLAGKRWMAKNNQAPQASEHQLVASHRLGGAVLKLLQVTGLMLPCLLVAELNFMVSGDTSTFPRIAPYTSQVTHQISKRLPVAEIRLLEKSQTLLLISKEVMANGDKAMHLGNHPEIVPLRNHRLIRQLRQDPEIYALAKQNQLTALLNHPKVKASIQNTELRKLAADVNWEKVQKDLRIASP